MTFVRFVEHLADYWRLFLGVVAMTLVIFGCVWIWLAEDRARERKADEMERREVLVTYRDGNSEIFACAHWAIQGSVYVCMREGREVFFISEADVSRAEIRLRVTEP